MATGKHWAEELQWFFLWSGAELGEKSTFPSGDGGGSRSLVVATPTAQQCAAARKQRRIRRVLLELNRQHQAVLETAFGPTRDTPPNLSNRFGISQRAAVVAWSMHRALMRLGRKVDAAVAQDAQDAIDAALDAYTGARERDQLQRPQAYPRTRRNLRRERVQSFIDAELVA